MDSAFHRRFLIVNADDFGLGPGINAGIARAATEGILTSVSVMANGPALAEALALLPAWPHVSPGAHLALVGGRPVCPPEAVASLVDREGRFPAGYRELVQRFLRGGVRPSEVYREWSAQARLLRERGVTLTHLDGHQHLHVLPGLLPVAVRVAREEGIEAVRLPLERRPPSMSRRQERAEPSGGKRPLEERLLRAAALLARGALRRAGLWSPDQFVGFADSGRMTTAALARHLENLLPGVTELMTHPGLEDPTARPYFPRPYQWEEEVAALTDPAIHDRLERLGIERVPYRRPVASGSRLVATTSDPPGPAQGK
jgi:chitin disaccharide deacetylase